MNKRSFLLGLLLGIVFSIAVFFTLPLISGLYKSINNSTGEVVQTFVDAVASGDRATAVSLLAPSDAPWPTHYGPASVKDLMDERLFGQGIAPVNGHVQIALAISYEITPAKRANGISREECWRAYFLRGNEGNYTDYISAIYVGVVHGQTYIFKMGVSDPDGCP